MSEPACPFCNVASDTYRAENLIVQAECSGSPLVILQALRHASRTRAGRFTATLLYVFGYATVIALWREAVHDLFAPAGSRELLEWWFIPAVIVAGWVVKYAVDHVAKWWLRRYRRSNELSAP